LAVSGVASGTMTPEKDAYFSFLVFSHCMGVLLTPVLALNMALFELNLCQKGVKTQ
jgi:hypothetical protein